jgi:hypothetical protein
MGTSQGKFARPDTAIKRIRVQLEPTELRIFSHGQFGGIEEQTDGRWLHVTMHTDEKSPYLRMRNGKMYRMHEPEHWSVLLETNESKLTIRNCGSNWLKIKETTDNQQFLFRLDTHAPTLDPLPPPPQLSSPSGTISITFPRANPDDQLIFHRLCGDHKQNTVSMPTHTTNGELFLKTPTGQVFCLLSMPPTTPVTATYYSDACIRIDRQDLFLCSRTSPAALDRGSYSLFEDTYHNYLPCVQLNKTNELYRLYTPVDAWMTEEQRSMWSDVFATRDGTSITNSTPTSLSLVNTGNRKMLQFAKIESTKEDPCPIQNTIELEVTITGKSDLLMGRILFGEIEPRSRDLYVTSVLLGAEPSLQTRNGYVWKPHPQDTQPQSLAPMLWDTFKMNPNAFLIMPPTLATTQTPFIRLAMRNVETSMFLDFYLVTSQPNLHAKCLLTRIVASLET